MFWRSVVGKLAITILLLVSFVLFVLTIFLLEFFENFHLDEAEKDMLQTASKVSDMVEQYGDSPLTIDTASRIKDPATRLVIYFPDGKTWVSDSDDNGLSSISKQWLLKQTRQKQVLEKNQKMKKQVALPDHKSGALLVGAPINDRQAGVFVFQSLSVVDQTKAETTKIIFLAAGIAIILTTIFAFFLSTRITSPLIKMREAAFDLARGEFNTKVPILTHDEIGELAMAFNRMGRQLKFHINALRQEKEQFAGILSSMADGVVTLGRNGEIIVANPPAELFLDAWDFGNDTIISNEKDRRLPAELNDILQEVVQSEKEVSKEINLQGRTWVMIMTPLYDQSYVRGAVAVIRDMTEERRLDKLRKDFIANVSHELRTPISMLQGYSEAIVDDVAESREEKNELAQIIYEESLRLSRLVNELLDLARMEAGHIQLNKEDVKLDEYIQRIMRKFKGVADDNMISLQLHNHLVKDHSYFDPDRIEQVFTNLIDNAIHHTDKNGFVKVTIDNHGSKLSVSIEDSGSGIPEEDLAFVFERFYKADKSRKRNSKKKGTGLGLSIAKNIIDAHHGMITVKSKLNHGTTFYFEIPDES
ncbi:ATP-binding protein [Virgibacillus halophilus]|uniref:ATP-binding protein n=1 Tax=Tigheibacillus halophilus TaxID=361280 RepID=UPI003639DA04